MSVASRLQDIMQQYGLNSSAFADKIGVQRSTLSHIISGRNKPSFDLTQRILESFPDLSPNWLITGKGSVLQLESSPKLDLRLPKIPIEKEEVESKTMDTPVAVRPNSNNKTVKAIVVLYTDGSAEHYEMK